MKKLILASVSALALLGVAACSDSGTDNTTTESTTPPAAEQPATPPATDNSTTQSIKPAPSEGTGGATQPEPAPAQPAQ
ncbi:MAG: hypothetical protein WA973_16050 [Mesorhizobium sp.]|jgi:hypothetical protein|uniref:Uncharacterized protein n=1 Tax=Aquamicrobium soli TaxID=1811518 RepID=A0ABV7KF26_9HYPH